MPTETFKVYVIYGSFKYKLMDGLYPVMGKYAFLSRHHAVEDLDRVKTDLIDNPSTVYGECDPGSVSLRVVELVLT